MEVVPWDAVHKGDCHTADVSFDVNPRGVCAVKQWDVADLLSPLSLSHTGKHPPWSTGAILDKLSIPESALH